VLRVVWLLSLALVGCQLLPDSAQGTERAQPLAFVELQLTFPQGIDRATVGSVERPATAAVVHQEVGVTAASAPTLIHDRVDFEVRSASLISRGGLHYIALEVEVTNRSGRSLRNLTMVAYRSRDAALGESAVTRYAGSAGHSAAAAARVTPFAGGFLPEAGPPLRLAEAVHLGTVFYAPVDPTFSGLRSALDAPPYRAFVADLFPYGFVVAGEGERILANHQTATLHLGFRVLPNTLEFAWRAVLVADPRV
jgi:hypothetical protein